MKRILPLATAALVLLAALALADKGHYLPPDRIDLTRLLAPPPADDSAVTKAEITELLILQRTRTPEQEDQARADKEMSAFRFADVLGSRFAKPSLPLTAALFTNILADQRQFVSPAKARWNRPRPYALSPDITPCLSKPLNQSYPSGHSTWGHLVGIVLANMVPEKAAELFSRADTYARQRVIGGVHYPSDVEAGKIAAAVIAQALFQDQRFQRDYEAARAEVRRALGL